ncbi:hypothetical protein IM538_07685 [Cytobacillus suaedae]|nr:hypothetical protein IM538_07685 [Cytobacillus suaedae]
MDEMTKKQLEMYNQIGKIRSELLNIMSEYWERYSAFNTWQFWIKVALLILPLIILYFAIDRRRMYQLGFYGFAVHTTAIYIDAIMNRLGFWDYPHFLTPLMPINVSIGASLLPVIFMLIYQQTLNKGKNYFLYMIGASFIMGLGFKPLMSWLGLFEINTDKFTYFGITIKYICIGIIALLLSKLFDSVQQKYLEKSEPVN